MTILTRHTSTELWRQVVRDAENASHIRLAMPLETYLVSLLHRFSNQPDVIDRIVAIDFMQASNQSGCEKAFRLQEVGDNCLIFSGLFPKIADKRHIKLSYYVDVGRSAYHSASDNTGDVFTHLAYQFVNLMDVLQTIRPEPDMLPLEAYEQWQELGSKRAKRALNSYTNLKSLS